MARTSPACCRRRTNARACYVLAHGAGAGMKHAFMAAVATELAERGIATLRYQFPYMEKGGKRPDPPKIAHAAVRAAVAEAARLLPKLPLIAGGKSFGGRMTSQAQAASPLPERARARVPRISAASGRASPSQDRAEHLFDVQIPMLFLQGIARPARDARPARAGVQSARANARPWKFFRTPIIPFTCRPRPAGKIAEVRADVLNRLAAWIDNILGTR